MFHLFSIFHDNPQLSFSLSFFFQKKNFSFVSLPPPLPTPMMQVAAVAHVCQRLKPKWLTMTDRYSDKEVEQILSHKMAAVETPTTIGDFTTLNFAYSFYILSLFLCFHYFLIIHFWLQICGEELN
jgi:hypothetical protein